MGPLPQYHGKLHVMLEYFRCSDSKCSKSGGTQQTVNIRWSLPPQTRVDGFTIEAISRNTEPTEKDALSFGETELPLNILDNNKPVFFSSASVFVDAVQQSTSTWKERKNSFRWNCSSFSGTFHRETLNMAWTSNNYKYVQSLMSGVDSAIHSSALPTVLWSHSITLLATTRCKKRERKAWRCVCVSSSECVRVCGMCQWVFACVLLPAAMRVQYELQ